MHRIIVLPDIHVPNHETDAVNAVLKFIKFYKPTHLVQLGDFCDWDSMSTYDPRREEDIVNIADEIGAANKLLDVIDSSVPKNCVKYMCGGNHEARSVKFMAKHSMDLMVRRILKFKSWHDAYKLKERNWKFCEYGDKHEIGKIVFTHGWFIGGNHAARHLNLWHKNILYGHTHTFQVAIGSGLDTKPILSASLGTLSKFELSYLVGKPPVNWIHMFSYIDMRKDGSFTPNFVPIVDGKFFAFGKEFCG